MDGLHQAAGAHGVVELHGNLAFIACLDCGDLTPRTDVATRLDTANPEFAGIAAAIWISPRAWVGTESYVHPHIWAAIFLNGLIISLPVALALVGTGLRGSTVAFMGWFGPRGLASIVLALTVAEEQPRLPGLDEVMAAMTVTVRLSVVAHGVDHDGGALNGVRAVIAPFGRRSLD